MPLYEFFTAFLYVFLWFLALLVVGTIVGTLFIAFLRQLRRLVDWLEALADNRVDKRAKVPTAKATAKAVR